MSRVIRSTTKLFGLFELDSLGTVLYSVPEAGRDSGGTAADIRGRNFYTEVAPFANVKQFRDQLDNFTASDDQARSFAFVCNYEDGPAIVRVLLGRIRGSAKDRRGNSLLVHIEKV